MLRATNGTCDHDFGPRPATISQTQLTGIPIYKQTTRQTAINMQKAKN